MRSADRNPSPSEPAIGLAEGETRWARDFTHHFGIGDHSNYLIALNAIAISQPAELPDLGSIRFALRCLGGAGAGLLAIAGEAGMAIFGRTRPDVPIRPAQAIGDCLWVGCNFLLKILNLCRGWRNL
jgi:hypothetical protein